MARRTALGIDWRSGERLNEAMVHSEDLRGTQMTKKMLLEYCALGFMNYGPFLAQVFATCNSDPLISLSLLYWSQAFTMNLNVDSAYIHQSCVCLCVCLLLSPEF